jgi:glycosyltransferase involved in cell wall biosynthesis
MSAAAGRVTIGVPIYRGEEFLEETLRCIEAQTLREFEVLMSIDGADPVCEEICAKFLKDPRFKLIIQPERLGWVGNLNWLLKQVATEFWYFHQQDDLTAPEYLEVLLEHALHNPDAALVYSDLLPMGRIEGSFVQPPSIRGANPYIRMMSALHEHFPAFAFRGLTRLAAVREAGPIPTNEVDNFGVDMCWLTGVARAGELLHIPRQLYWKRYHARNTESKWWAWPQETRLHAWAAHCVNMLEQVMHDKASPQELRMLWLGAIERLTSPQVASHFLRLDQLTTADRQFLLASFLEGIRKRDQLDLPRLLEAEWRDIHDWARAFYWLPTKEPLRITNFGPQQVTAGSPFNVQVDGKSAIWVRISHWAEPGLRIRIGDVVLETVLEGDVLTAAVPFSLTREVGRTPLVIVGSDGPRTEPVFLEAVARQEQTPAAGPPKTSTAQLESLSDK